MPVSSKQPFSGTIRRIQHFYALGSFLEYRRYSKHVWFVLHILAVVFAILPTQTSLAAMLRLSAGLGSITDQSHHQEYRHRSVSVVYSQAGYEYTVWSQVRVTNVTNPLYKRTQNEAGFGYASYLPGTVWWLGGGGFGKYEEGTFLTNLGWGQASYAIQRTKWLQLAVTGGSRTEHGRDGGIGQIELQLLQLPENSKWLIGGFAAVGHGQLPGGGGVVSYQWFGKRWQWKSMVSGGDFPHWFERETLLKYETTVRMNGVGRTMLILQVSPKLRWENTFEVNRAQEEDSWFVNSGLAYQW